MTTITVYMAGVPQGSHSAFIVRTKSGMNRAVITDRKHASLNEERIAIAEEYQKAGGTYLGDKVPIKMDITFGFLKPKSTPKKVTYKMTKPDLDKMIRGVLDAFTGVAYKDDSQVVSLSAHKCFAEREFIRISIEECTDVIE